MSLAQQVLAVNDDLPIRTQAPVHSGKVRSVYWLTPEDSARLIRERQYQVAPDAPLAIMIISDRISAFDCIWRAEGGLNGVPGKGAALNAISHHWFTLFRAKGLADSHILEVPHPLVWIVQKARPVKIEAIGRQYITGSMWRAYSKGEREFCGITLPDGLQKDQRLPELLITPSTKGILRGIPGVPEADDVNISRGDIEANYHAFNFSQPEDIDRYETVTFPSLSVIFGNFKSALFNILNVCEGACVTSDISASNSSSFSFKICGLCRLISSNTLPYSANSSFSSLNALIVASSAFSISGVIKLISLEAIVSKLSARASIA